MASLEVVEPALRKARPGDRGWLYFVQPVELLFTSWAPRCDACGHRVHWQGPPVHVSTPIVQGKALAVSPKGRIVSVKLLRYRVLCPTCGEDEIDVDWPLRVLWRAIQPKGT